MKSINNIKPFSVNLISTEIGYTKIRFTHTTPSDLDISHRVAWTKVQGALDNTAVRSSVEYEGQDYFYINDLLTNTLYDVVLMHADEFLMASTPLLQEQYLEPNESNVLSLLGLLTKKPVEITNISNNTGGTAIGTPPSTVTIELDGSASNILIEAAPEASGNWEVVYSGASAPKINITMAENTYDFRVTSVFVFADNTIDPGGTINYSGGPVSVGGAVLAPNAASGLVFSAFKELDTSTSFNLKMDWSFDETGGGAKRHFNVYVIELATGTEDPATVDYSNATVNVAVGTSYVYVDIPYRKHYAFKIEVAGWNNNLSPALYGKAYVTEETEALAHEVIPTVGSYSPDTRVQIDNRYIRGYKEYTDAVTNTNTFEFDAATGNVTIGTAGLYGGSTNVTTPFLFDATNARLAIAGQTITDEIISASFVMGWLSGETPSFRTANKNSYSDGTSGIWMGYEDATTFKMDVGNATNFMRWDGTKLSIAGNVIITDPNDPNTELGTIAEISSSGSIPRSIFREDYNYYDTGALLVPITGNSIGSALNFVDVTRSTNEPITISVKLRGAGASQIHIGLNSVDLGTIANGVETDRWYHFQGTSISGNNTVSIWDTANDSVSLLGLVVTYGTPSSDFLPTGWEATRPAKITVHTVISNANVSGSTVLGNWSVPTTLNAIDGVDGNRGNFIDYVYKVSATEPTKPADYDVAPAGWNPDIPVYTVNDIVWISQATRDGDGDIIIPWSSVTRWNAVKGEDGQAGPGFYSQSFPYQDSNSVTVTWAEVKASTAVSHAQATNYFYKFFNRLPAEHEVLTQYDGNNTADSITMMYQSGIWTSSALTVHGNMIVDGSIRAQALIADNLSALRAELGDVTAGSIRLGDSALGPLNLDIVFNDTNVETVVDFTDRLGDQSFQLSAETWQDNYYRGRIGKDSINTTQAITVDTRKALNPYYLGDADIANTGTITGVVSGQQVNTTDNANVLLRSVTNASGSIDVQVDCRIERTVTFPKGDTNLFYKAPKWSIQLKKKIDAGSWINLGAATTYTGSGMNYKDKEVPPEYWGSSSIKATHSALDTIQEGEVVEYGVVVTRVDGHGSGTYVLDVDVTLDAATLAFQKNTLEEGYFIDKDTGFCTQWGVSDVAPANTVNNNQLFNILFTEVFVVVAASKQIHIAAESCHATSWQTNGFTWVNAAGVANRVSWVAYGRV